MVMPRDFDEAYYKKLPHWLGLISSDAAATRSTEIIVACSVGGLLYGFEFSRLGFDGGLELLSEH
jgi:hypothetical protein